jgi:hypothetical protein
MGVVFAVQLTTASMALQSGQHQLAPRDCNSGHVLTICTVACIAAGRDPARRSSLGLLQALDASHDLGSSSPSNIRPSASRRLRDLSTV